MINLYLANIMIECNNISIKKENKLILDNINLKIKKGEKILIRGESGSGKTSLIRSMLFFEKFSGSLIFENNEINIENITEYRNNIGYIGQRIPNFHYSVGEFLKIHENFKFNRSNIFNVRYVEKLLEKLNFETSILKSKFNILSGGEKQRIAVIGILLLDRPIYIYDEVTSALDPKNIDSLISLIMEDKKKTVLAISHNIEWGKKISRIINMNNGGIIEDRLV